MILDKYDSYKDSEVEWLGEIPNDWKLYRLKDMVVIRTSNVDKKVNDNETEVLLCNYMDVYKNEFITSAIAFMKATATNEQIKNFKILKNDVIITKDSETSEDIAVPAFVEEELENVICGYHLALIREPIKNVFNKYIFRLFQSSKFIFNFVIESKGITRVGLSINNSVKNQELFLPSYKEQINIANFLDEKTSQIDKKTKLLQEKKESYEEFKKTLINETVCRGLNKDVELKDSGIEWIGKIPKHWEVERMKNIFKIEKEVVGNKSTDYKLLSLTQTGVIPRDINRGFGKFPAEFNTYQIVKPNDLIFCLFDMDVTPRTIGISNYFGMITGAYTIVKPIKNLFNKYYYYLFLMADNDKKLSLYYTGLRNTIRKEKFFSLSIPFLSYFEQNQIANYLDNKTSKIEKIISKINAQIETLKEFRKTLINDVVTGKVRIQDE